MTETAARLLIDPDCAAHMLRQEAVELLDSGREITLDFSALRRIAAKDVAALEELFQLAENRGVPVKLESVNTGVYKVLRLLNLTRR